MMAMTTSSSIRVKALRRTEEGTGRGVMAALGIVSFMEALAGMADKGQVRIGSLAALLNSPSQTARRRDGNPLDAVQFDRHRSHTSLRGLLPVQFELKNN